MARTGARGRLLAALATGFTAVVLTVAPAGHAWADPSVQDLEKMIDAAWNTLEPTIEQYNQVHSQLTANQAKAAQLQKQIAPLQMQVDLAMARVSDMAVVAYMGG